MQNYNFSKNWFEIYVRQNWDKIVPVIDPKKILEIGTFEGAASCYLIETLGSRNVLEIHCIDTWEECEDIKASETELIEKRFDYNIQLAIKSVQNTVNFVKHKEKSHISLSKLISQGINDFDFIYVDASHYAVDVLTDAVLAFKLLKVGGILIFDDYLWTGDENIIFYPKIAIDSFTNIFSKHIKLIPAPCNQIFVIKTN